jgi:mono/diheme cytochrome c family protein
MRLLGRALLGLIILMALSVGIVYGLSSYRLSRRFEVRDSMPSITSDSAAIERGRHLTFAIAKCADCHDDDLGGKLAVDAGPVGKLIAPNLTTGRGGIGAARSDSDLVRAIRHGVAADGRPLRFMPATAFAPMSDADVASIVAYVRSVPPVDRENPPTEIRPLGRLLYVTGQFPILNEAEQIPHDSPSRTTPAVGVTVEYGRYLATIGGCHGCHGPALAGGQVPGTPPDFKPASNLTPRGIGKYTEADFFRALREAKRPDGSAIDPFMPVKYTRLMTDDEIRAIWLYLRSVPAREFGEG